MSGGRWPGRMALRATETPLERRNPPLAGGGTGQGSGAGVRRPHSVSQRLGRNRPEPAQVVKLRKRVAPRRANARGHGRQPEWRPRHAAFCDLSLRRATPSMSAGCNNLQLCTGCGERVRAFKLFRFCDEWNIQHTWCDECRRTGPRRIEGWSEAANPDELNDVAEFAHKRIYALMARGLSVDDFVSLWVGQRGCCPMCLRELVMDQTLAVDHDHACCRNGCRECVRGLTCRTCNLALGMYETWFLKHANRIDIYIEKPPWKLMQRNRFVSGDAP